jgi:hypothetical protein
MAESSFRLLVEAPGRPISAIGEIARRLSRSFETPVAAIDLAQGTCVLTTASLDQAKARVEAVLEAGADFRIVDETGATMASGRARRSSTGLTQPIPQATMLGWGTRAAPPPPPLAAPAQPPADPSSPAAPAARPAPPVPAEADTVAIATSPTPGAFDLDALDTDALVTLDGESESSLQRASPGVAPTEPPQPSREDDRSFGPPDDEEAALELDAPVPAPRAEALELDDSALPSRSRAPEPAAEPAPEPVADATPEPMPEPSGDPHRPEQPALDRPMAHRTAARRAAPSGPLLLGGRLRQWPRLRVLAGFVLALGLGSVVPMCHATSVVESSIEPARKELSRAKAYGHLLSGDPGYRSPQEISDQISSIKWRKGAFSLFLWLLIGGALGAAWFRFT